MNEGWALFEKKNEEETKRKEISFFLGDDLESRDLL